MNVLRNLPALALALVFGIGAAAPAQASDIGIQVHGKKGSIGIHIGKGHRSPSARPVGYAPRVWVPAHYETIQERVWVPGREERVWVAPVYQWHYDPCGRATRVCVRAGYWDTVCTSGRYEYRSRQVWVPGAWRAQGC